MKSVLILALCLGLAYFFTSGEPGSKQYEPAISSIPVFCAPALDWSLMSDDHGPLIQEFKLVHLAIATKVDSAQLYFDQGLSQLYAFNHGEAGRSFKTAIRLDPTAAMPYWGLAMVLGPNYNAALNPGALKDINEAIQNAKSRSLTATELEKGLINALALRFPATPVENMTPYNAAYVKAMKELYELHPSSEEIAVLYIDALMNEHPWNFWLKDGTAQPWTSHTVSVIESVLKKWPDHPGAIHYYIHATEASREPEKALPFADKLAALVKGNGHLVHMPSHTYIRTGDYHKGVLVNEEASASDSVYISQCRAQGFYPMLLYPHNIHFLAACAFLEGSSRKAIDAAWMVSRKTDKKNLAESITVQHFYSIPYYVLAQLEKWEEILRLPMPGESLKYPKAIWHYARGLAFAGKSDYKNASLELTALDKIATEGTLKEQIIWDMNPAQQLVDMAVLILKGELNARQGKLDLAITQFKEAIQLEDQLNYNEPPDWFFSNRLRLGSWLIKSGQFVAAEKVYREDLETFPENGWALHGLQKALTGQGKMAEAGEVQSRFQKAWQWADITLK
jgi:tetratricopeptide (TPR) repeat protein